MSTQLEQMLPPAGEVCPMCDAAHPSGESCVSEVEERHQNTLCGVVLNGKWEIEEPLGEGGMGIVYRGRQRLLHRPVAIKVLRPDTSREDVVARFKREAQAVAAINHPNCVTIYDFDETESGLLYIAMELCTGTDLGTWVDERGALTVEQTITITEQIADALSAAHALRIVHRDLKPENVFVDEQAGELRVKVLDFGIAKMLGRTDDELGPANGSSGVLGTPAYMSPEQLRAGNLDPRADLYSLGCVMYEMLTGASPFGHLPLVEMIVAQARHTPETLAARGVEVPPALEDLVMQLLSKRPDDRPLSVDEVQQRLLGMAASDVVGSDLTRRPRSVSQETRTFDWDEVPAPADQPSPEAKETAPKGGALVGPELVIAFAVTVGGVWAAQGSVESAPDLKASTPAIVKREPEAAEVRSPDRAFAVERSHEVQVSTTGEDQHRLPASPDEPVKSTKEDTSRPPATRAAQRVEPAPSAPLNGEQGDRRDKPNPEERVSELLKAMEVD